MTTTTITIIGNLVADPELRFLPNGTPVANFTIASTPRRYDKQAQEWKDGTTLFMRSAAWRDLAENIAQTLTKGAAVIATGELVQRDFETREGEKRTVVELTVDNIGPSLRKATAQVTKTGQRSTGGFGQPQPQAPAGGQTDDPWATAATNTFPDEIPF